MPDGSWSFSWPTVQRPDLLWVDAICIDQRRVMERNHQVPLMRDIYSQATRVLVWLGDHDPPNEAIAAFTQAVDFIVTKIKESNGTLDIDLSTFERTMQDLGHSGVCSAINSIFASQWHNRVWCVQEVALAQDVTLLFQNAEFPAAEVGDFAIWFDNSLKEAQWGMNTDIPQVYFKARINMNMFFLRLNYCAFSGEPLRILQVFRGLKASDPRDNVYGLLGIMDSTGIQVDYTKTAAQVYIDTTLELIAHERNLCVLSMVSYLGQCMSTLELPSWVPQWDTFQSHPMYPPPDSGMFAGRREPIIVDVLQAQSGVIRLVGLLCDRVSIVTQPLNRTSEAHWKDFYLNHSWTSFLALATTLTFGQIAPEKGIDQINSEYGAKFLADFRQAIPSIFQDFDISHIDLGSDTHLGKASDYYDLVSPNLHAHRLFRTQRQWVGLGPGRMQDGDVIVVFTGSPMPMILRPANNGKGQYYLVGECYIYDIALGQAYDILGKEGVEERTFELI